MCLYIHYFSQSIAHKGRQEVGLEFATGITALLLQQEHFSARESRKGEMQNTNEFA